MRIFESLRAHQAGVEQKYGGSLTWEPLEGKRACRIVERFEVGGYRDEEKWPEIFDTLTDAMARLEAALRSHIAAVS